MNIFFRVNNFRQGVNPSYEFIGVDQATDFDIVRIRCVKLMAVEHVSHCLVVVVGKRVIKPSN